MEAKKVALQIIKMTLFVVLFVSLGVYSGIRNAEDDIFQDLRFSEIKEEVQVYRDDFGVPTILAKNINDLAFVQGYEFARDRAFQLEMYHALINARLSTIFGIDLLEADVMIQTLNFKAIGEKAENKLDPLYLDIVNSYVHGINLFFEQHAFNLPWEFQALGIEPGIWEVSDSLSMQAVLAYYSNFDGFANELKRLTTVKLVGMDKSLELLGIQSQETKDYLLGSNATYDNLQTDYEDPFSALFQKQDFQPITANSWVVGGNMTSSGNPIISNELNTRFTIPSFWYQVKLQLPYNTLNVQGYSIPGLPLILMGHNKDLAWSIGESNIDSVDLLYFNSNATHYFHDGVWKNFVTEMHEFVIAGVPNIQRKIYKTDMGPVLNISEGWYSVKWTLLENNSRDLMLQGIYHLNTATSISEAHSALEYITAPSINFIFAELSGGIGMQSTGLVATREYNNGIIPENGSLYPIGWIDFVDYESMYYIAAEDDNYIVNGLQLANNTNSYYIYDKFTSTYQSIRLNQLLNNSNTNQEFSMSDAENLQADIFNLAAKNILQPILTQLTIEINALSLDSLQPIIDELNSWDYLMDTKSTAASIFETFRLFYNQEVYGDELSISAANMLVNNNVVHLDYILNNNQSDSWFDDITTLDLVENALDIALRALNATHIYLSESFGRNIKDWEWGKLHQITYKHVMGDSAPLPFLTRVNLGPISVNGSTFTVNSYPGSGFISDKDPDFRAYRGPSLRLIIQISKDWENVRGQHAPGMSGYFTSDHYDDGYKDWSSFTYRNWVFDLAEIVLSQELSITYSHGD